MNQTIADIKKYLNNQPLENIPLALELFSQDERAGVKALLASYQKKYERHLQEQERLKQMAVFEKALYCQGIFLVAGIDEVGRGPLAGPVVAGAVILPRDCSIEGINDSKKLTPQKRELLSKEILDQAVAYGFGVVSAEVIDRINILQATFEAMRQAVAYLNPAPEALLVDALTIPDVQIAQQGIIKGDEKSVSIAAASIIAKVKRDHMMEEYDRLYPGYFFAQNKGYGSREHVEALKKKGPCPIHRRSFLKNIL